MAGAAATVAEAVGAMFTAAVLWNDVPLIDRTDLRGHVKRMLGPGGRRALLVKGPTGAGKTYTRQFIRYVSENALPPNGTKARVSPVDAARRAGSPIDVREPGRHGRTLRRRRARTELRPDRPAADRRLALQGLARGRGGRQG